MLPAETIHRLSSTPAPQSEAKCGVPPFTFYLLTMSAIDIQNFSEEFDSKNYLHEDLGLFREEIWNLNREVLAKKLIDNARLFFWRKYDSVYENGKSKDGRSKQDPETKEYMVSYNKDKSYKVSDKPLVCGDLIVESLKNIWNFPFLNSPEAQESRFYLRRVKNLEYEFKKDTKNFKVEDCNETTTFLVWDIITTSSNGKRHIGIVTGIWPDKITPSKMIHSSYTAEGVVENNYNDFIKQNKKSLFKKISIINTPSKILAQK